MTVTTPGGTIPGMKATTIVLVTATAAAAALAVRWRRQAHSWSEADMDAAVAEAEADLSSMDPAVFDEVAGHGTVILMRARDASSPDRAWMWAVVGVKAEDTAGITLPLLPSYRVRGFARSEAAANVEATEAWRAMFYGESTSNV